MVLRISRARPIVVAIQFIRRAKPLRFQRIIAHINSSHARGAAARAPEERNTGGNLRRLPGRMQRDPVAVAKADLKCFSAHSNSLHFSSEKTEEKPEVRPQSCFAETGRGKRARHRRAAYLLLNNDGVLGTYETNWTVRDTDGDRLWDGFDYYTNPDGPSWHYGELFLVDYNWRPFFQNANQSDDTNATVADSDGDGLDDGDEVYGWGKDIYVDQPSTDQNYDNLTSDPSDTDTDNDGLSDVNEYDTDCHPLITDTDLDGLRDYQEYLYGTSGKRFDTDGDMIPDGYVENWWRNSEGVWGVYEDDSADDDDDEEKNVWEGEDLNVDGDQDIGESDADDSDSDDDGIKDGFEYFFDYIFAYMDPSDNDFNTSSTNYDVDGDGTANALDTDSDNDALDDDEEDVNGDGKMEATKVGNMYPEGFITAYESNPYDNNTDDDWYYDGRDLILNGVQVYDQDFDGDNLICAVDNNSDGDIYPDSVDPDPCEQYDGGDTDGDFDEDNDNDGLLDSEEDLFDSNGDPNPNGQYDAGYDPSDLNDSNTDSDSLNDSQERENCTLADDEDTDNDGLCDDEEVETGDDGYITDPTNPDTDADGLNDGDEYSFCSDPLNPDKDNDGLNDTGEYLNGCDPNNNDTDGDGILDGLEDRNGNGVVDYGETDPNNWDTDGDGLADGWIDQNGDGEKQGNEGEDTDGDGNQDHDCGDGTPETGTRNNGGTRAPVDSDGDGLSDLEERDEYGTDPGNPDTDGDGVNDNVDYFFLTYIPHPLSKK